MITRRTPEDLLSFFEKTLTAAAIRQEPQRLYDPVNYILSLGGKRIRPVMLMMACELFGRKAEDAMPAALGIEMFHNFSLVHDDIMDRAPVRRGKPTVHEKWDANAAILSGDTMLVLAYQHFLQLDHSLAGDVLHVFSQTAREVCEGQQYDMDFETDRKVSIDDYLEMIRLKTAVLVAASYRIGAIIAGAGVQSQQDIYDFGLQSGMAFQLKDDLLDTYGDEKKFGKRPYGDIHTNKKTYLYLKALELADTKQTEILMRYYSGVNQDPDEKVKEVLNVFNQLDISRQTEVKIMEYYERALKSLNRMDADESGKNMILDFTERLMDRNH
jgi:geranylgeranyl diphosphate synthase, type II